MEISKNEIRDGKEPKSISRKYYIVIFKKDRTGYFIDRNKLDLKKNDLVAVQAEKGQDVGRIHFEISEELMKDDEHRYPLEVLRKLNEEDKIRLLKIRQEEDEMFRMCQELIEFRGLDMKLVDVEQQFDGSKITFYFTAPERVDFRQLVRDLAAYYRVRIELRQIGARDESKKLGGIGTCGLPLCCFNFLNHFESIPTQFARGQGLAVNPSKISGLCGRLMCCLGYEQEYYETEADKVPGIGETVETIRGKATVEDINFLKQLITIRFDESSIEKLPFSNFRKLLKDRKVFLEKWKKN
ncbi:stage 0 sporulation protein [bacterium]|nr:stage 0 sporulation protein [bacterium]